MTGPGLPPGLLLAWYGDDYTGAAAVMEVMEFAGLPAVMFLDAPTPAQLARFPGMRAVGIAGVARARPPAWMDAHLPPVYAAMRAWGAELTLYKVCSTLDSAPHIGSIGRAADLGRGVFGAAFAPFLVAAPVMGRHQAFGQLFARGPDGAVHRIDRHPVMARHPVTPMDEADVRRHLARQTAAPVGLVDLEGLRAPDGGAAALARAAAAGAGLIALDAVDEGDMARAGRLIWEGRRRAPLAVGSQGVAYALIAHWQAAGLHTPPPEPGGAGPVDRIAAVSGSVSATTAAQLDWAQAQGFAVIPFAAEAAADPAAAEAEAGRCADAALAALSEGRSAVIASARGPADPSAGRLAAAAAAAGVPLAAAQERLGAALGTALARVVARAGLGRVVVSGGDTSGRAAGQLGIDALTALAPTIPGAALCRGHRPDGSSIEIALKGGQMGSPDYLGWIRAGGGPR